MSIEFSCLHCGHRMAVADDRAGDRMGCSECQGAVTVPAPIGGRLTEKRLDATDAVESPNASTMRPRKQTHRHEPTEAMELTAVESAAGPEPSIGFEINITLDKLIHRKLRERATQTAQDVVAKIYEHLHESPEIFRSGAFVLAVDRYDFSPNRVDTKIRLYGTINGERFSKSAWYAYAEPNGGWSPLIQLAAISAYGVAQRTAPHSRVRAVTRTKLCDALDEACGRRVSWLQRLARFFTRPAG